MNKKTLTVGIPAYNEQSNIYYILKDLLAQKLTRLTLKRIYVNSDGSTDKTVNQVKRISSAKINLIDNIKRAGRAVRQNEIIERSNTDILVLIDADTLIKDKNLLEKICLPIIQNKADLTSVRVQELSPENFTEKILETSMKLKKYLFESINNGDNVYTCHGRARAFSKKIYKSIKFTDSITEDAYSYLYCIAKNMNYKFVPNTEIYYKLPMGLEDHKKQSIRFIKSQKILEKQFGPLVRESYRLPIIPSLQAIVKFSLRQPLFVSLYLVLFLYMKAKAIFTNTKDKWEISESSKKLRKELI